MLSRLSSFRIAERKALFLSPLELFLHYSNSATVSRVCWPLQAALTPPPPQAVGAPAYCTLWPVEGAPGRPGGTPLAV